MKSKTAMKFDERIQKITQQYFELLLPDAMFKSNPLVVEILKDAKNVKITWRDKLRWVFQEWKLRFSLAFDAIRGKHDCGEY